MNRLPAELVKQVLLAPGVRLGRTVGESLAQAEPQAAFADEKAFMVAVIAAAKRLGWKRIYHAHNSRKSAAGFPDLVLVRERVVWAELKTETGRLSADQLNWIEDLTAAGQEIHIWRPSNWPQALRVLR